MIVIDRFYTLGEAESARLELGCHGIDAYIEHENTATLTPFVMSGRKNGIELKISAADADLSREILLEWKKRHADAMGNPPYMSYFPASLVGAILGLLLIKPLIAGALSGLLIALVLITIYNRGIEKGYRVGRTELSEDDEMT